MNTGYGWYIRHIRTGKCALIVSVLPGEREKIEVVDRHKDATKFDTLGQAFDMLVYLRSNTFPACDLIDYYIADPPPENADKTPVKSFEQIVEEARARNEPARRAAHEAREANAPSGVLLARVEEPSSEEETS